MGIMVKENKMDKITGSSLQKEGLSNFLQLLGLSFSDDLV